MLIRDIERAFMPRQRTAKDVHPLRKTAEGLGVFLDRLSEAVRDGDSVDSDLSAHRRGSARGFKWPSPHEEPAPPIDLNLDEEQADVVDKLREARTLASNASSVAMSMQERDRSQERLQAIFMDLSAKRIEILSSMMSGGDPAGGDPLFSLLTPDSAKAAYVGIEEMIMCYLDAGTKAAAGGVDGADVPYIDHGAAISASEQLRDFLLSEGPAKAFARFREVNRSSVLGLLQ